jgi:hypothetical protein
VKPTNEKEILNEKIAILKFYEHSASFNSKRCHTGNKHLKQLLNEEIAL